MVRGLLMVGAFLCLAGCAHVPEMAALDLARRAAEDIVRAQLDLVGEDVVVRGIVQDKVMARRPWRATWLVEPRYRVRPMMEDIPVVVLSPGTVFCYFEQSDSADVAAGKKGEGAAYRCTIESFRTIDGVAVALLSGCRRFTP
jgi:hypothetical protein